MMTVMGVACPWCKSRAGQQCIHDSTGERIRGFHPERVQLYWSARRNGK